MSMIKTLKESPQRTKTFVTEVRGEWKKVTKPPRQEVVTTTAVVVVTSIVFAIFLALSDFLISKVYSWTMDFLGL